jgi:hypothetical protein
MADDGFETRGERRAVAQGRGIKNSALSRRRSVGSSDVAPALEDESQDDLDWPAEPDPGEPLMSPADDET